MEEGCAAMAAMESDGLDIHELSDVMCAAMWSLRDSSLRGSRATERASSRRTLHDTELQGRKIFVRLDREALASCPCISPLWRHSMCIALVASVHVHHTCSSTRCASHLQHPLRINQPRNVTLCAPAL